MLPSRIDGMGLYTRKPIKKGETVVVWGGHVFSESEVRAGKARRHSIAEIGEGVYLASLADDPESPDDLMNHSCDPNLWMIDEVTLVARRNIGAWEELTIDYAMWCTDPEWGLKTTCRCEAMFCRKVVTGNDWMLKDLHIIYGEHFSPYISRRIKVMEGLK